MLYLPIVLSNSCLTQNKIFESHMNIIRNAFKNEISDSDSLPEVFILLFS